MKMKYILINGIDNDIWCLNKWDSFNVGILPTQSTIFYEIRLIN